jgi:fused signal recognition particle receptor
MEGLPLFQRLKTGLAKTREGWAQQLEGLFKERSWNEATLAELEEILLAADVGVKATQRLSDTANLYARGTSARELLTFLQKEIAHILKEAQRPPAIARFAATPWVMLFLGVNGVGKTTTIGKLAARYVAAGKSVMLVAADTFRAAAIEQLGVWAERTGATLVRQQHGADPGAVVYDGIRAAIARGTDVVFVDTAGRLHTKSNLMDELRKVRRVIGRELPGAPHETLLVLDAVTGQNGLAQARAFLQSLEVDGIVLTKLDGTAKGGIVIAIAGELAIPIRYVGVGERVDDLRDFDPDEFVSALFASPGDTQNP